jgi:hypothetical protein
MAKPKAKSAELDRKPPQAKRPSRVGPRPAPKAPSIPDFMPGGSYTHGAPSEEPSASGLRQTINDAPDERSPFPPGSHYTHGVPDDE